MAARSEERNQRRVSSAPFYKNNSFATGTALNVLRTLASEPSADNKRLSLLTGLGVTKDEAQGVLPTYLNFLLAMDLIRPGGSAGSRFEPTNVGTVILEHDPHGENPATLTLMALLMAEPGRGAHMFDWAVRDLLWKLRPFKLPELEASIGRMASAEGVKAIGVVDPVMRAFTERDAFGTVSPWIEVGNKQYEPMVAPDLPEEVLWACAYVFLRSWSFSFPTTFDAQRADVDKLLLRPIRGVVGLKGPTEEALLAMMEREGLVRRSAVTSERIYMAAREQHQQTTLTRPYRR